MNSMPTPMPEEYVVQKTKVVPVKSGINRSPKQLHALIRKYVKKWSEKLFLGLWRKEMRVVSHIPPDEGQDPRWEIGATTRSNWHHLQADLEFSHYLLCDKDDKTVERMVIHELLHVLLNEMRESGLEHEERVVSHLEIAFEEIEDLL